MGGRQPETSLSVSSTTMNRKFGNDSTSTNSKLILLMKSFRKRPSPTNKRLSESAVESFRTATRDPPSKLAGLPFAAYKRAENKTVPAPIPGRSIISASPVDKNPVDTAKAPLKRRRVPSGMAQFSFLPIYILNLGEAPQTTRHLSKNKAIPSDAEIIEISDDDDLLPSSISQAKSKSKFNKLSALTGSHTARVASGSATKEFLPKAPVEVIEISDDEKLPSKAQLREKSVGRSSSGRLSELGSNPRRDQSQHISSLGGVSFEGSGGYADAMNIDGGDSLNIPSSPPALPQILQVIDDTNDDQGTQGSIPLPSSSPSSVGLSPKANYLSTPPASTPSVASLTLSSPLQQPFALPTRPNSAKEPITASPSVGTSTGSPSNRLGFSSVAVSSSLQAPPPADKHLRQFARKTAIRSVSYRSMSYKDEDIEEGSSESKGTANTKANKGKEKEIRESPSSSSGTESINMRGLRDALTMDPDTLNRRPVSPTLPKKQGQTLAEAIISAGQLNRMKRMRRPLQRNVKDVPVVSDVEAGVKDGPTADENEKALKAAIGSSRLLVNLLPSLKEKSSVNAAAEGDYIDFLFLRPG